MEQNEKQSLKGQQNLIVLTQGFADAVTSKIDELKKILQEQSISKSHLEKWLDEKSTQELLGLKTTTLWKLRKEGKLITSKIGAKTYYSVDSINILLEKNAE